MKYLRLIIIVIIATVLTNCSDDNEIDNTPTTEINSFSLHKYSLPLIVGGREKIYVITHPENATIENIKWTSSNKEIATIDENGIVAALNKGKTTINATINGKSESCIVEVIQSPITNLKMPDAKYPIVKDAMALLQADNFPDDLKIILRKNTTLKSTSDADDILAEIHEQSKNHVLFYCQTAPGNYNVILEAQQQYNLGNLEIEVPNIPPFEYDKSKIFWDDTHWRWGQLRSKVKKLVAYTYYSSNKLVEKNSSYFNEEGFLISQSTYNFYGFVDSITFRYDKKNRIIEEEFWDRNSNPMYRKFIYGDHDLYYNTRGRYHFDFGFGFNLNSFNYNFVFSTDLFDESGYCINGLIQINDLHPIGTKIYYPDSIVVENSEKDYHTTVYFKNKFPNKSKTTQKNGVTQDVSFQFDSHGKHKVIDIITNKTSRRIINKLSFETNSPFQLIKSSYQQGNHSYGSNDFSFTENYYYDTNWNIEKYEYVHFPDSRKKTYKVISYDQYGNWLERYELNGKLIYTEKEMVFSQCIKREITYWE